jgi:hypothetical protein
MDRIKQGQELSRSLTNVGGAPGDTMTIEALANLSEEEFMAKIGSLSKAQLRRLAGG